jgi:hypothetical protein
MAKNIELPVIGNTNQNGNDVGLGRRKVLQGLLTGAGAGLAIPGLAAEHPMHAHLAEPARAASAEAKAAAAPAGAKPSFLGPHEFETLSSLAEQILPGSKKLKADRFVDELLAVDSQENQRAFLAALGGIEGASREQFSKPWTALTPAQQVEVLTTASTLAPGGRGGPNNLRDHFDHLKGWVVGAYYSSEAGMRELGWTGNSFFPAFNACTHEGHHQ